MTKGFCLISTTYILHNLRFIIGLHKDEYGLCNTQILLLGTMLLLKLSVFIKKAASLYLQA